MQKRLFHGLRAQQHVDRLAALINKAPLLGSGQNQLIEGCPLLSPCLRRAQKHNANN